MNTTKYNQKLPDTREINNTNLKEQEKRDNRYQVTTTPRY